MIKKVNFLDYQILKFLHNVTVLTASDFEAVIFITY